LFITTGEIFAAFPDLEPDTDELRAQWMAPFIISPHDSSIVYAGYQFVFRSKNRGDAWEKISPDLSYNDKAQIGVNPSAIPYQTVVQMAESPVKKDLHMLPYKAGTTKFIGRLTKLLYGRGRRD